MRLWLREWRSYYGLSQEALAERAKLEQNTISRIEKAKRARPTTVTKIANALRVEPQRLYGPPPGFEEAPAAASGRDDVDMKSIVLGAQDALADIAEQLRAIPPSNSDSSLEELRKRMTPEEFLAFVGEGFQALALDGSLSAEDVIDRIMRVRTQLKKDGKL